jgi:transcriptional regulator with XRE-family HTH domain
LTVQNERSAKAGARRQHGAGGEEVLSAVEMTALTRGQMLKRYVRAAAALQDLYDDSALGKAVGRNRAAVGNWWRGAKPDPEALLALADVTGLSTDELTRFVYADGPPPTLPEAGSPVESSVAEGLRRDQQHQPSEDPDTPAQSSARPPRESGAGRG